MVHAAMEKKKSFPQSDLAPFTCSCPSVVNTSDEGGVITGVNVPRDNALPGGGQL